MIIFKVDKANPDSGAIHAAADAVKRGELVIFPTETVYGLAADALNEDAVRRVFEVKGRIENHPLPVQVAGIDELEQVTSTISNKVKLLADTFWPGPMTLVLPKSETVSDLVTGGRGSVGVRVPDHPVALALLSELGSPIVASSANLSGNPSAKSADEALADLSYKVSIVLDCGPSDIGVASTVIDMCVDPPRILRRGVISADELREIIGEVADSEL